jgi:hypothetical protein
VLLLRTVLAIAMILLGIIIAGRMLLLWRAGFTILPGLVLGAAMIALGVHRISLILRLRRMT